jgi:hypothetical protein
MIALLVLSALGQACEGESFSERFLWPVDVMQKVPIGISIDDQGNAVALTYLPNACDDCRLKAHLINCGTALVAQAIPVTGWSGTAAVARGARGEFFIASASKHNLCVQGQAFDSLGSPLREMRPVFPDPCEKQGEIQSISLAVDREGNVIAAWAMVHRASSEAFSTVSVRKLDVSGEWLGPEFFIHPDEYADGIVSRSGILLSTVTASESGQVLLMIAWKNRHPDPFSSYLVWLLDADLRLVRGPIIATREGLNVSFGSAAASDSQGNFVVAWRFPGRDWQDGTKPVQDRIVAQRFTKAGEPVGPEIQVSGPPIPGPQFHAPGVVMAEDGRFLIYWTWEWRGLLMAQRFSADGERLGRLVQLNVRGPLWGGIVASARRGLFALAYWLGSDPGPQTVATRVLRLDAPDFIRGDFDGNEALEISDVVGILHHLFLAGPPPAVGHAADVNDDGAVNVSDPIFLLTHLFLGGPRPPHPYPMPGFDPTPDG